MNTLRPTSGEMIHPRSLEELLRANGPRYEAAAKPETPLTYSRLQELGYADIDVVREAIETNVNWPDELSTPPIPEDARLKDYRSVLPDRADELFAQEIVAEKNPLSTRLHGYNNFPALLRARPDRPQSGMSFMDLYHKSPTNAVYGTKPYLWRAYMLEPELMNALREQIIDTDRIGMTDWRESLMRGASHPESYPEDSALLRASRLGYHMLINLMHIDDLGLQNEWVGKSFESAKLIVDPEKELWT